MEKIIACSRAESNIKEIDLKDFSIKTLLLENDGPIRPCALKEYEGKIIVGCEHSQDVYIIDESLKIEEKFSIGATSNDIDIYKNKGFFSCSDINSLRVVDLDSRKLIFQIPLDNHPFSIAIDKICGILYISNFYGNTISIVDCNNFREIDKIYDLDYPSKILLSDDRRFIYVCESRFGSGKEGYISIFSLESRKKEKSIKVDLAPIDILESDGKIYVANLESGSLNIIDLYDYKKVSYNIGIMPIKILALDESIFVADYYTGFIKMLKIKENKTKIIAKSEEPSAMIFL